MKRIPYTTKSGVQIGIRYEPQRVYETSRDMERLQVSLIGRGQRIRMGGLGHYLLLCAATACVVLIGAFWR